MKAKKKQAEIFYIEADRRMTGGATRGRGGEIIIKIEGKVNDRRERGEGITTSHCGGQIGSGRKRQRCRRREERAMSNRDGEDWGKRKCV